jgi:hypothetical protein
MGQPTPDEFAIPYTAIRPTQKEKADLVEAFNNAKLHALLKSGQAVQLLQLEERGLPTDLVGVLREAPAELDPGEDPDPFGMMKMFEGEAEETSGT